MLADCSLCQALPSPAVCSPGGQSLLPLLWGIETDTQACEVTCPDHGANTFYILNIPSTVAHHPGLFWVRKLHFHVTFTYLLQQKSMKQDLEVKIQEDGENSLDFCFKRVLRIFQISQLLCLVCPNNRLHTQSVSVWRDWVFLNCLQRMTLYQFSPLG